MPDFDTDLFRWIVLGFMSIATILLVVIAAQLARIARALAPRRDDGSLPATAAPAATGWELEAAPSSSAQLAETLAGAEVQSGAVVAAAEPQPAAQPFERDGRWWFQRDDELLVYDESTGEWVAAPEANAAPDAADAVAAQTSEPAVALETVVERAATSEPEPNIAATEPVVDQTDAVPPAAGSEPIDAATTGMFWKCPSCGAINGSTAATCRMCFAARA